MDNKRALLVGINKYSSSPLNGCVNDVYSIKSLLQTKYNYKSENITTLLDDQATRNNILKEFFNLIMSGADYLVFHFSGHGTQSHASDTNEHDGYDETIVTFNIDHILDSEIKSLLTFLSPHKKMTMIFDCCHSGSIADLKYQVINKYNRLVILQDNNSEIKADITCLSGCRDDQTSADVKDKYSSYGLFTRTLIDILKNKSYTNGGLYTELLNIKNQTPQMSFSNKYLNLSDKFIL